MENTTESSVYYGYFVFANFDLAVERNREPHNWDDWCEVEDDKLWPFSRYESLDHPGKTVLVNYIVKNPDFKRKVDAVNEYVLDFGKVGRWLGPGWDLPTSSVYTFNSLGLWMFPSDERIVFDSAIGSDVWSPIVTRWCTDLDKMSLSAVCKRLRCVVSETWHRSYRYEFERSKVFGILPEWPNGRHA